MSLEYIRSYYGVPAFKGHTAYYNGKAGVITGSTNQYVNFRLNGERISNPYHPTELRYKEKAHD